MKILFLIFFLLLGVPIMQEGFIGEGLILATVIGTIPASSTGTISLTYVPQYLIFTAATPPSALRVNVLGDGVIKDLDTAGIEVENNLNSKEVGANGYKITLADGFIVNKNVDITITNAVASPLNIFGTAQAVGAIYAVTVQQKVFQGSGQNFDDFAYLGLPAATDNDILNITYVDGLTQKTDPSELPFLIQDEQANRSQAIENFDQTIKLVNFTPAADQQVYLMRYQEASGVTDVKA